MRNLKFRKVRSLGHLLKPSEQKPPELGYELRLVCVSGGLALNMDVLIPVHRNWEKQKMSTCVWCVYSVYAQACIHK